MGSIFKTPSPPVYPPVTITTTTEAEENKNELKSETANTATIDRSRKGLAQNINTSWRGILDDLSFNPIRKNLLGE